MDDLFKFRRWRSR